MLEARLLREPTAMWTPGPPRTAEPREAAASTGFDDDDHDHDHAGSGPAFAPGDILPGSRLRIVGVIGRGGAGVVYRGIHTELEAPVAIKVLRAGATSAGHRASFLAEARTAMRIRSPHVVDVLDFGELDDGRQWYAMAYVEGEPMDALLLRGVIDPRRVVALLRMACRGLAAVHRAGMVHRDVKPGNLVLRDVDGLDQLVVVDFGIACAIGTVPTAVVGTPAYMAPEQISCDLLGAAVDIYGLGACAYEMLLGAPPTDATTLHGLLRQHIEAKPVVVPDDAMPASLADLVRRCLASDPADRPADMDTLEAELAAIAAELDGALASYDDALMSRRGDAPLVISRPSPWPRAPQLPAWIAGMVAATVLIAAFSRADAADTGIARTPHAVVTAGLDAPATSLVAAIDGAPAPTVWMLPMPTPISATVQEVELSPPAAAIGTARPMSNHRARTSASVPAAAQQAEPTAIAVSDPESTAADRTPRAAAQARAAGRRALGRGDRRQAISAFVRAVDIDAADDEALGGLADAYFDLGQHARALTYARRASAAAPRDARHRVRMGDAYFRQDRKVAARLAYQRGAELGSKVATGRLAELDR